MSHLGDTATLNPQSCIAKEKAAQQEAQQSQTAEAGIEGTHYYDSADLYDQPVCIALNRGSPHREKPPAINTQHLYELASVPDSPHYETASFNTPYEVPVSPYEIPTPRVSATICYLSVATVGIQHVTRLLPTFHRVKHQTSTILYIGAFMSQQR